MSLYLTSLLGGIFIGLGAVVLMFALRRIAGISTIVGELVTPIGIKEDWRWLWLAGLLTGALLFAVITGKSGIGVPAASLTTLIIAGVFVGVGTSLGNGCTSGHGVCGLARLSPRSLIATLTFIFTGVLTVMVTQ